MHYFCPPFPTLQVGNIADMIIRPHFSITIFILFLAASDANAQQVADKIVAVVGKNRIILQSELEVQAAQAAQQMPSQENIQCEVLQQMIMQKMLMEQAERDSIVVSPEEVEGTLENRIRYFISMYGSKDKLEEISGKTIYQLKEDNREVIKESMLAERVQQQVLQNIKVTPAEVRTFFANIPADSLPFFPATVEIGQIVIDPDVSPEVDAETRKKLEGIRNEIVNEGADFELKAALYSEDPGSRNNGGDLGTVNRKSVVSEFAAAAFKLQNGEISQIVKTKFGYHIIQMVQRKGEDAHLRHILIKPTHVSSDYKAALEKLDSIRAELITGKINFPEAVGKYSTDEMSNRTGGMVTDERTGSTQMEVDKLDPSLALMVDSLKTGDYSQPHIFTTSTGERSARIVYMKNMTTPHKANLKDDYSKIQEVTLQQKRAEKMNEWLMEKAPSYYLKIDPAYAECDELKDFARETVKK